MCDYKNDEEIKKEIETAWNKMHNECSTHSTGTFYIHDDGWHPILNNAICDSELKVSIRKENVDFDENRMSNVCYDGDDIEAVENLVVDERGAGLEIHILMQIA